MADEEVEVEGKKKSPLVKIIIIAVAAIVLLAGAAYIVSFLAGRHDSLLARRLALHAQVKRGGSWSVSAWAIMACEKVSSMPLMASMRLVAAANQASLVMPDCAGPTCRIFSRMSTAS